MICAPTLKNELTPLFVTDVIKAFLKVPAAEEGEGGGGGRLILSCKLLIVLMLLFGLLAVFPDPTGLIVCGLALVGLGLGLGLGLGFVVVTVGFLPDVVVPDVVVPDVVVPVLFVPVLVVPVLVVPALVLTGILTFPALPSLPRLSAAASSEVRLLATALSARLFLAFISSGVAAGYLKAFSLAKLDSDSTLERSGANSACPEAGEPLSCVFFCSGSR